MAKAIRTLGIIASFIAIAASALYLVTKNLVPGLLPFSLIFVILSLVYTTKEQYDEGKANRLYWLAMLVLGIVGGAACIVAGVIQIMS